MRGKAVPQGLNPDAFDDARTPRCQANNAVKLAPTRVSPAIAGKQPAGRHPSLLARGAPPVAQQLEKVGRQHDIAILLPLALLDPDDHALTIDIGELQ